MSRPTPSPLPPLPGLGGAPAPARSVLHAPAGAAAPTPPLTSLPKDREAELVYGFCRLDRDGRMHIRSVVEVLGWKPGDMIAVQPSGQSIRYVASPNGRLVLDRHGHLRVPLALRESRRIGPSTGVLLVADPTAAALLVYPPSALDVMIARSADQAGAVAHA